jgi:hypothetical protein
MAKKKVKRKPNEDRLMGTHFYREKGLKGVVVRTPNKTKKMLKLLAAKLGVPVNEAVQMIFGHFFENHKKYNLPGKAGVNGTDVEITVFVNPDAHRDLRIHGIYADQSMKDLAGQIIDQYLTNHSRIKLDLD